MPSARLVAIAILLCSALTIAQDQKPSRLDFNPPQHQTAAQRLEHAVSEYSGQSSVVPLDADSDKAMVISPNGQDAGDQFCYTIRSYVVARDDKDSDSVHFVRSSTCQPSNRYRVRTIEMRSDSFGH